MTESVKSPAASTDAAAAAARPTGRAAQDRATPFACVLLDLGVIRFTGADAAAFLNGQLTSPVLDLADGASQYGAYCTPKGRVLATLLLWRAADRYLALLPREVAADTAARLKRYVLRSKVAIDELSEESALLGVNAGSALPVSILAAAVCPLPGATRRMVLVQRAELDGTVAALARAGLAIEDAARWHWLDINSGFPWIGSATRDQFVAQMLNLDAIGAVGFHKGCYPGQEIVARAHYLGEIKRRMYLAHLAALAVVAAGDALYTARVGGQACGTVINAAPSPLGGQDLLAVVRSDALSAAVAWKAPDGPQLEFRPLPYAV